MKSIHELTRWNLRKKGKGLREVGRRTILRNKKGAKPVEISGVQQLSSDVLADTQSTDDESILDNTEV